MAKTIHAPGEAVVHSQLALQPVRSDGADFHFVPQRLQFLDHVGARHGGVQDDIFALGHSGFAQLCRPLAGVSVGMAGPGVRVLVAKLFDLRVLFSQLVWIDGDDVITKLKPGCVHQIAFACAGLPSGDDGSWAIHRRSFEEQFRVVEYVVLQYLLMLHRIHLVVAARHG
jgi:hypothetical protein